MPGNTGSAEHATGGSPDPVRDEDPNVIGENRSNLADAAPRHLYLVRRAATAQVAETMTERSPPASSGKSKGLLDRAVQGQIGRMLRDIFADVAEEAVPERFVKLLEALEAREKQS